MRLEQIFVLRLLGVLEETDISSGKACRHDVRKALILFLFVRSTKARTKNSSPKSDAFFFASNRWLSKSDEDNESRIG